MLLPRWLTNFHSRSRQTERPFSLLPIEGIAAKDDRIIGV